MVTRSTTGEVVTYPVVETVQKDHICHVVRAPGAVSDTLAQNVKTAAMAAVEAFDGVGSFGVEFFLLPGDEVVINEMAPRN